tara:strand:- start:1426 stop:1761 length:336 start_codon:yes stop_codon:yes gene_type:complete
MEKDDEVSGTGNSYTTFYRQNDTRLGRWKSVDPKMSTAPWESPYISMGDNPIWHNDPMGDKWGKQGAKKNKDGKNKDEVKAEKILGKATEYKKAFEAEQAKFQGKNGWTLS